MIRPTRRSPDRPRADAAGPRPVVKAGRIVQWLKDGFDLGHGQATAIVAAPKGKTG